MKHETLVDHVYAVGFHISMPTSTNAPDLEVFS
jgi:hypothetical protein